MPVAEPTDACTLAMVADRDHARVFALWPQGAWQGPVVLMRPHVEPPPPAGEAGDEANGDDGELLHERAMAHRAASWLEREALSASFGALFLVGPSSVLRQLVSALGPGARGRLVATLTQDLAGMPASYITAHVLTRLRHRRVSTLGGGQA